MAESLERDMESPNVCLNAELARSHLDGACGPPWMWVLIGAKAEGWDTCPDVSVSSVLAFLYNFSTFCTFICKSAPAEMNVRC